MKRLRPTVSLSWAVLEKSRGKNDLIMGSFIIRTWEPILLFIGYHILGAPIFRNSHVGAAVARCTS